jgi:type VI secretion system protein ImpL
VWWVLSGLLVLIVWALWFTLDLPTWVPVLATVLVALTLALLYAYKWWKARRAATALERAIAQQGAQQALSARPERRAEIQELHKQVQVGIDALKKSKLAGKKKGGISALYSLPWYVIIGPPGAGKTTALKHSGLVFPYADPSGGGVRGVGGTRNCDWWFTNEAILLDTAGRYATEQADHDEWIAFLQMLRKYRSRKPINGVLVAVSITDVIDANEQQIEAMGKKLRARIDEVMTQLQMVVPVYVLFTKCDLISGFIEFFGDLRRSDRAQAWGTTMRLDMNKTDVGRIFDTEFDVLCKHVHARALKRLATERNREAREKIYQFPLEFAGVKRNIAELIQTIFAVNSFQGTPIFRGFYFTSGTQEGRPLDRVLQRMSAAMGVRTAEQQVQQVVESKSYFLYDMFMKVVFPDANIAARSEYEIRRQKLLRYAVSAAAAALAIIVAIPGIRSFANNRAFVRETEEMSKAAMALSWTDGRPANEKMETLKPLLGRLQAIDGFREKGPPSGMGWAMYQGETVYRPSVAVYVSTLQQGFVMPAKTRLEAKLKVVKGDAYLRERLELKTYLMLNDIDNLDVEWATGRYTALWAEMLRATTNIPEIDLKKMLSEHVRYYFTLLKEKRVLPLETDKGLVDQVRKTLQGVPVQKRYYDQFVNILIDEKYDEAAENTRINKRYPSLNLQELFTDRPEVLKYITSQRIAKDKRYQEVDGPYTEKGHWRVVNNVADGAALLAREQWVVPLTQDEQLDRVPVHLSRLADDYDTRYVEQWKDWLADIKVAPPATVKDAVALYTVLITAEWPYLRILRKIEDHTQWKKEGAAFDNEDANRILNQKVNQQLSMKTQGLRFNVDIKKIGSKLSVVPGEFKKLVEFAVPPATGANVETPLAKYAAILENLRNEMQKELDVSPNGVDARQFGDRLNDARKQVLALLQGFDDKTKAMLKPLLLNPLEIQEARLPPIELISKFNAQQTQFRR